MERRLIDYIPPVLQGVQEIQALTNAEQLEIERLWDAIEAALDDQFILSLSTAGAARWESILEIAPAGELEDRRIAILLALFNKIPFTMKRLKELLSQITEGYRVELNADEYMLLMELQIPSEERRNVIRKMLRQKIPANLILDIIAAIPQKVEAAKLVAGAVMTGVHVHEHTAIGGAV